MSAAPLISVVTAAYKRPASLQHAMRSALAQSCADFEYLVIGDCCEDNTEEVVRGFDDKRIVWRNLPQNTGHQSGVNKAALEMARGQYIAYLNQDDLWFPDHLATLVEPIREHKLDLISSLCISVFPPGHRYREILGMPYRLQNGVLDYQPMTSTTLHTLSAAREVGGWIDWRENKAVPTIEFFHRLRGLRGRFGVLPHITTLKFHSGNRVGSYVKDDAAELARYARLMAEDPLLRYREAMVAMACAATFEPSPQIKVPVEPEGAPPGWYIEQLRNIRGLDPRLGLDPAAQPKYEAIAVPPETLLRVPEDGWPLIASGFEGASKTA